LLGPRPPIRLSQLAELRILPHQDGLSRSPGRPNAPQQLEYIPHNRHIPRRDQVANNVALRTPTPQSQNAELDRGRSNDTRGCEAPQVMECACSDENPLHAIMRNI
jgi:hypothetical protein